MASVESKRVPSILFRNLMDSLPSAVLPPGPALAKQSISTRKTCVLVATCRSATGFRRPPLLSSGLHSQSKPTTDLRPEVELSVRSGDIRWSLSRLSTSTILHSGTPALRGTLEYILCAFCFSSSIIAAAWAVVSVTDRATPSNVVGAAQTSMEWQTSSIALPLDLSLWLPRDASPFSGALASVGSNCRRPVMQRMPPTLIPLSRASVSSEKSPSPRSWSTLARVCPATICRDSPGKHSGMADPSPYTIGTTVAKASRRLTLRTDLM
mmetsp:Transcript_9840/g.36050  ORF Transcript_9840/g.36050 Transcript_9840/m.36050 type:complete len:267 (-) Transcript_9840:346-1146(-)